jgi:hypothetical protein
MLRLPGAVYIKSALRHVTLNLCFLHPMGFVGHVVHSTASLVRNVDTLFFIPGWDWYRFHKKSVLGHVTPNLCFCIRWDLRVM